MSDRIVVPLPDSAPLIGQPTLRKVRNFNQTGVDAQIKIEELKSIKDRRPFQPFFINVADGRSFEVRHPDGVSWGAEGGRILSYISPRDEWELIDIALVTSLGSVPATAPADQGTRGERRVRVGPAISSAGSGPSSIPGRVDSVAVRWQPALRSLTIAEIANEMAQATTRITHRSAWSSATSGTAAQFKARIGSKRREGPPLVCVRQG
jgi:hypothetical protein